MTVVVLAGLGGAGCGLPTPDGVRVAGDGEVDAPGRDEGVVVRAPDPVPGASPQEIVGGFLFAQGSPEEGFAIARQFLGPALSRTWRDARDGVLVLSEAPDLPELASSPQVGAPVEGDQRQVTVQVRTNGRVDPDGWSVRDSEESEILTYGLTYLGGEWRITALPPERTGLTLTSRDRQRRLVPVQVMFLSTGPGPVRLVTDLVRIARDGREAQRLVEQVVDGPSQGLAGSARTAVPAGTQVREVRQDGGQVTVDLSGQITSLTGRDRELLSAQLLWTLRLGLADVTSMVLLADGRPYPVDGSVAAQSRSRWDELDPTPRSSGVQAVAVDRQQGAAVAVSDSSPQVLVAAEDLVVGAQVREVVEDESSGRLAVVAGVADPRTPSTLLVGRDADSLVPLRSGELLSSPSWGDGAYGVWCLRWDRRQDVLVHEVGRTEPYVLDLPDALALDDTAVLRLSRDGTRAALVDASQQLWIGRVEDDEGRPVLLGWEVLLREVRDVTWTDATSLLALDASPLGQPAGEDQPQTPPLPPRRLAVDGVDTDRLDIETVLGASSLTAYGNQLLLAATSGSSQGERDVLYRRAGVSLALEPDPLTRPRFPG